VTLLRLDDRQTPQDKTVVCIGFFDGVHLGHARLIETARDVARQLGLQVVVHTFSEMPANVLRPDDSIEEITNLCEKAALLGSFGVELVAVSRFDLAMARMRAADFFQQIIIEQLRAAHVVAGFDHRFGFRSEADTAVLARLCAASRVGLSIVPPVCTARGVLISSSAIRQAIRAGDLALAEEMLGRPVADKDIELRREEG